MQRSPNGACALKHNVRAPPVARTLVCREEDSMTNMTRRHAMPYMALGGLLVLSVQMATGAFRVPAGPAQAASSHALPGHRLPAPIRFRLVPSGLARAFPHARGAVTINPGSLNATLTVDVAP